MKKYLSVFVISFQQEFCYRVNFVMWRLRNILQIFLVFFLWNSLFSSPGKELFGYDKSQILTYIFGLLIVRAFVLSARAVDVAGEIANGNLSNYLLKPFSYFKYWLVRDFSSKSLNLVFALVETTLLFIIFKPPFFLQTNPLLLLGFVMAIILAMFIYFFILFITSTVPFWMPEAGWASQFLVTTIFVEFLSGALFPLDVLPHGLQSVLNFTPFPYLIFFPLRIYLGKVMGIEVIQGILISLIWLVVLWWVMQFIWKKGLRAYQAYGR